jgi:cytochrome b6-f complex iron-sulfur subunit
MAKKMSVEEILAAARAEKAQGGASPPPAPEKKSAPEAAPAKSADSASNEAATSDAPSAAPAAAAPSGKVAPGGKGMSMADILAAARAGKGGAAKPAAVAEKPAKPAVSEKPAVAVAEKAAPKSVAKPAAKTDGGAAAAPKDTASILAAARKASKPGPITKAEAAAKATPTSPVAKKKLEVPPMPSKPDYARAPAPAVTAETASRRNFLAASAGLLFGSSLAVGFTSLAVTHLMWLLGFARFMFPNILIEPPTRFKVGFPDSLAPGQVETKYIPQFGVWIVRYEFDGQPMIFALKSVCTHLGCTPNWLEAEQKFKCPCHGSGFYKDGVNFEGPAPRPLERYAISLADDGQLLVDKSRTFQQELGQWKDTTSFVTV